jgi:hypothetical protein
LREKETHTHPPVLIRWWSRIQVSEGIKGKRKGEEQEEGSSTRRARGEEIKLFVDGGGGGGGACAR